MFANRDFLFYNSRMKCAIITTDKENAKAEKISAFLKDKCEANVILLSEEDDDDQRRSCVCMLSEAAFVVLADTDSLFKYDDFLYYIGFIASRKCPVVSFGESSSALKGYFISNSDCFYGGSEDDALDALKSNLEKYRAMDEQRWAFEQLFVRGIPFNADSLAHYIEKDDLETSRMIVQAGLDVNAFNSEGVPMLCVASRNDNIPAAKWLLECGANVNIISKDRGYSPVMDAVWRKNKDTVKFFIENGADMGIMSSDGQPILVLAVGNGSIEIVQALLEAGADPDVEDGMWMSARGYAKLFKNEELISILDKFPKKAK